MRALDARVDGEERGPRHAVLQARPRRLPQRARTRRLPPVERPDAAPEGEDLLSRQVEQRYFVP
jgi:hypothetical protein